MVGRSRVTGTGRSRPYDDRVTPARVWSAVIALTLACLTLVAPPANADDDPGLSVKISGLSPAVLRQGSTISISGTVTNDGDQTWTAIQAYLVMARSPFTTRSQVETALSDDNSYIGDRIIEPGSFDEVGDLAGGTSTSFALKVDYDTLGLLGLPGVYPVGVQILATDSNGNRTTTAVARATTFLPWVDDPSPMVPSGTVWSFLSGSAPGENLGQLMTKIDVNGVQRRQLDLAAGIPASGRTLLLDPALLDDVSRLAEREDLPEDVDISDAQAAAASAFLTDLLAIARSSVTWLVGYGRPDVLAISRQATDKTALIDAVGEATQDAAARHGISGPVANWPTRNGADQSLVSTLRAVSDSPTLITPSAVPDWEHRFGSVVSTSTAAGPALLVVNGGLPDLPGSETVATLRQRILADAALASISRDRDENSRADALTFVDPAWDPGADSGAGLEVAFDPTLNGGVARGATLNELANDRPRSYDGEIVARAEAKALSGRQVDEAERLLTTSRQLTGITADDDTTEFDRQVASAVSVGWRLDPTSGLASARADTDHIADQLRQITIEGPSNVTLSTSEGSFPLTITNGTEYTISVGVRLDPGNPALELPDVAPVEIAPGDRRTVSAEVDVGNQSSTTVTARVVSSSGEVLPTDPAVFNVRSSRVGLFVWIVMGLAAAGVVVSMLRRFRRRRRLSAAEPVDRSQSIEESEADDD